MREILAPYPFSKNGLYMRIMGTVLLTATALYLLFNTIIVEYVISFIFSYAASYVILTINKIFNTKKILKALEEKDRYIISEHSGNFYHKFLMKIIVMVTLPFLIILIYPTMGLGLILGVICGHGSSELTHYTYTKKTEKRINGKLYYFTSIIGIEGKYFTGIKVAKLSEKQHNDKL